jgi:GNAT superfamily N-acetyltransferase
VHTINAHGDQLFVNDSRSAEELLNSERLFDKESLYIRTQSSDGHQTGIAKVSIQVEKDINGNIVRNRARLHDILVTPASEGKGFGRELIKEVESQARRFGSTEVYGYFVPEKNPDAVRRFYERNGYQFRQVGDHEEVYKILTDTPDKPKYNCKIIPDE